MKNPAEAAFVTEFANKIIQQAEQAAKDRAAKPKGGPQTPQGKAASSRNAVKHNLSGQAIVVTGEDANVYEETLYDLRTDHRPRTATDDHCVEMMAHAYWKTCRCARLEKSLWDLATGFATADTSPFHKMAEAFLVDSSISKALDKIARYQAEARRAYHQAAATLRKQQPYTDKALETDTVRAIANEGELAAIALQAIAHARYLQLRHLANEPVPETNSQPAQTEERRAAA